METSFKSCVIFCCKVRLHRRFLLHSKWKFNLCCDDFVGQHRCLVTVAPQMTDKSHKNFEQFALRRLYAWATGDSRATAVSGTHPLSKATRYMYLEY